MTPANDAAANATVRTQRTILIGCAMVYGVGNVAGWLSPEIMFGAIRHYGVSAGSAGLVTLVEGITAGLLSMLLGIVAPRLSYRSLASIGVALFLTANGVSPLASSFEALLAIRFIAGVADALLIFVGVSVIASRSTDPDRGYAAMNLVANLFGAVVIGALPVLAASQHGLAYLPFAAGVTVFLVPLVACLPRGDRPVRHVARTTAGGETVSAARTVTFLLLVAIIIPEGFQSFSLFTFAPGIGTGIGMTEAAINTALGTATLASIAGPFLASLIGNRFGRWIPLFLMAVVFVGANALFVRTTDPMIFRLSLAANLTAAFFFLPLILGWAAELDPSGRFSSIAMGVLVILPAGSPAIAGLFYDRGGTASLLGIVTATTIAFLGLLILLGTFLAGQARRTSSAR